MNLILGTVEFGEVYGEGVREKPSEQEIVRILNLAWEAGIRTLDTAEAYNCYDVVQKYAKSFDKIHKSRNVSKVLNQGYWYHYKQNEARIPDIKQASVYTLDQLRGLERACIPFSINNTTFAEVKCPESLVLRSVFDRGRLLKEGYTVKDCLDFVKRHFLELRPSVIVGVNSVKELEEILKAAQ